MRISLIIVLLFCLFEMPYWYYELLRIFGTIGFVYLAYQDHKAKLKYTPQIFVAAAILLNPIIKISFGRGTWQIFDLILIMLLLVTLLFEKKMRLFKI